MDREGQMHAREKRVAIEEDSMPFKNIQSCKMATLISRARSDDGPLLVVGGT